MGVKYVTWIDGEEATVDILSVDGSEVAARIESEDGAREIRLDRETGRGGAFHIILPDGRAMGGRVVTGQRGERMVRLGDHRVAVRTIAERDAWMATEELDHKEGEVSVSMPGLVVKMFVGEGDAVSAGDTLLTVEAMKMENEVKAGRDGVVTRVHVADGESVEADAVLMEIGDG